jgi:multiple sugar transport system substrate-binding protein
LSLWIKSGKTFAVPFSTSPFFVFFNEDLFRKAGVPLPTEYAARDNWTWDTFRSSAAAIKKTAAVYGFQGTDGQMYDARILHTLVPVIRSYGGDVWDGKRVLVDGKEALQAVTLIHMMLNRDHSIVPPGSQNDFFSGGAAMTFGQISRISKLASVTWKWGIVQMPKGPAGSSPVVGQAALGVFAKGKNTKISAELAACMTSQGCVARMAGIWPPARTSVLFSDEFLKSNPAVSPDAMKKIVAESIKTGRVLPAHIMFPQIEMEMRPLFDRLWKPETDIKATLGEIARVIRKYVK